jgi:hypothetical protein
VLAALKADELQQLRVSHFSCIGIVDIRALLQCFKLEFDQFVVPCALL